MRQHLSVRASELVQSMTANIGLGKWNAACDQAKRVVSLVSADSRSLAHAGWILEVCGAWRDAAELYRHFADLEPDRLYPRLRLCHVLNRAGGPVNELNNTLSDLHDRGTSNPRIAYLKEILGRRQRHVSARKPGQDLWRRWFEGQADCHEGKAVSHADLAVVVIGFKAQPGLGDAVRSLLEQDEKAEIVVVNSGGGCARDVLAPYSDHLRIIDVEQPLYAGAARNVGIDATDTPYIAFLAGDCIARPGWTGFRLMRHRQGSRAVASAIVTSARDSDLALAAHIALFGARSPEVPPTQALRYGASYERQVFREFGYFNPSLRISEDTDFARRTGRAIHPVWDPRIQTEHASPRSLWRFVIEMYQRGSRAESYRQAVTDPKARRRSPFTDLSTSFRQRKSIAEKVALEIMRVDKRRMPGIRRYLLPATLAYALGGAAGSHRLRRAARAHATSVTLRGHKAMRHSQAAVRLNPYCLDYLLHAAGQCLTNQNDDARQEACCYLDRATQLAGFDEGASLKLAEWLVRNSQQERAWLLGEIATTSLPCAVHVHHQLALAAHDAGDMAAFELASLDALARNPNLEGLWPRLGVPTRPAAERFKQEAAR